MITSFKEYEIDERPSRIDIDQVHAWLTTSYWSPGITLERVRKAFKNTALVVGVYRGSTQVGVLRVISDKTTFAWIADVWVDEGARGQGIARAMVRFAQGHPDYQGLRRWVLATQDAQGVYRECGFELVENPERWMIFRPEPSL